MFARLGFALALLAFAASSLRAQTVTILDQNGQQVVVPASQFQTVGPHPGVIDVDHLHAQNGNFVVGGPNNDQFIRDPARDPNGRGYILANGPGPQPGPPNFNVAATVSVGVVSSPPIWLWSETQTSLDVSTGLIDVVLGACPNNALTPRSFIQESSGGKTVTPPNPPPTDTGYDARKNDKELFEGLEKTYREYAERYRQGAADHHKEAAMWRFATDPEGKWYFDHGEQSARFCEEAAERYDNEANNYHAQIPK